MALDTNLPISTGDVLRALEISKDYTIRMNDAEKERALAAEKNLDTKIEDEKERAVTAEGALMNGITTEANRASSAETSLERRLQDEILRAQNAENLISNGASQDNAKLVEEVKKAVASVTEERERAIGAEDLLQQNIDTVGQQVNKAIDDEVARATQSENEIRAVANTNKTTLDVLISNVDTSVDELHTNIDKLESDLNAEADRATKAETDLDVKVTELTDTVTGNGESIDSVGRELSEEINRATAAEEKLQGDLEAEVNRATTSETDLRSDLEAEIQNRGSLLQALADTVTEEINRATTAEATLDEKYDIEIHQLTNTVNGNHAALVNEDAKLDGKITVLRDDLTAEKERSIQNDENLMSAINNEVERATNVENGLRTLADANAAAIAAETARASEMITAETTRATEAEAALSKDFSDKLDAEGAARSTRDGELTTAIRELRVGVDTLRSEHAARLDTCDAKNSEQDGRLDELDVSAVFQVKQTDAGIVATNMSGKVMSTIEIASADDVTTPVTRIVTKGFVKEASDALNTEVTSKVTAVDEKLEAEMEARRKTDLATANDIHDLKEFQSTTETTLSDLDTNKANKTDLPSTFVTDHTVRLKDGFVTMETVRQMAPGENETALFTLKSSDDSIRMTMDQENNIDLTAHQDLSDVYAQIDTKVNQSLFDGQKVVSAYEITRTNNAVTEKPEGDRPVYGYTWTMDKTDHVFDGITEDNTTRTTIDMFTESGAEKVQEELYDEIARSTVRDRELNDAIVSETAAREADVKEINDHLDVIDDTAFVKVGMVDGTLRFITHTEKFTGLLVATDVDAPVEGDPLVSKNYADGVRAKVHQEVVDETTRATEAETALRTAIDTEEIRATEAEEALNVSVEDERTRAEGVEAILRKDIDDARAIVDAHTTAIDAANASIANETTRATGVETSLNSNLEAERTRSMDAEAAITTALEKEVTRATAKENELETDLDSTRTMVSQHGETLVSIDGTITQHATSISELKTENAQLKLDLASANTTIAQLDTLVAQLRSDLDALAARVDGYHPATPAV